MRRALFLVLALAAAGPASARDEVDSGALAGEDYGETPAAYFKSGIWHMASDADGRIPLGSFVSFDFSRATPKDVKGIGHYSVEGTLAAELDRLEPSLERYVKLRGEGRATMSMGAGTHRGPVKLDGELFAGLLVEFEVRMPEKHYRKDRLPNPFDPRRLPRGAELSVEASKVRGSRLRVAFRNIAADLGYEDWTGMALAIERIEPDKVRVLAGPIEGVRANTLLGLQVEAFSLEIGNTSELKHYRLASAEIQVDSDEGLQSYYRALLSGRFDPRDPSQEHHAEVDRLAYQSETSARVRFGAPDATSDFGMTVGGVFNSSQGMRRETRYLGSGKREVEAAARFNNQALIAKSHYDHGELHHRTFTFVFRDVDAVIGEYLETAFHGDGRRRKGDVDAVVSLDEEQALRLRDAAREASEASDMPHANPILEALAKAPDAESALIVLLRAPSPGRIAEELLSLSLRVPLRMPGIVAVRPHD